jgi:hypothetical protein
VPAGEATPEADRHCRRRREPGAALIGDAGTLRPTESLRTAPVCVYVWRFPDTKG